MNAGRFVMVDILSGVHDHRMLLTRNYRILTVLELLKSFWSLTQVLFGIIVAGSGVRGLSYRGVRLFLIILHPLVSQHVLASASCFISSWRDYCMWMPCLKLNIRGIAIHYLEIFLVRVRLV